VVRKRTVDIYAEFLDTRYKECSIYMLINFSYSSSKALRQTLFASQKNCLLPKATTRTTSTSPIMLLSLLPAALALFALARPAVAQIPPNSGGSRVLESHFGKGVTIEYKEV
jgi:hypothetical protein